MFVNDTHIEHNGSGYVDTTVDAIIKKENDDRQRVIEDYKYRRMTKMIKDILDVEGYTLEGPISLIKIESGRKRRIY